MIQSSIWISPRKIPQSLNNFISDNNLSSKIQTINFSVAKDDLPDLISQAWKINRLNLRYNQFVEEAKERFSLVKNYHWQDQQIRKKFSSFWRNILKIVTISLLKTTLDCRNLFCRATGKVSAPTTYIDNYLNIFKWRQ